ncbi:hypothetical protein QBC44DRAFT_328566 [Cladorrhinum sp. PSN332]|nr:hypothetical protein QBC44DRAFT_328566 [Cladorrhinum sp. PSN332]
MQWPTVFAPRKARTFDHQGSEYSTNMYSGFNARSFVMGSHHDFAQQGSSGTRGRETLCPSRRHPFFVHHVHPPLDATIYLSQQQKQVTSNLPRQIHCPSRRGTLVSLQGPSRGCFFGLESSRRGESDRLTAAYPTTCLGHVSLVEISMNLHTREVLIQPTNWHTPHRRSQQKEKAWEHKRLNGIQLGWGCMPYFVPTEGS